MQRAVSSLVIWKSRVLLNLFHLPSVPVQMKLQKLHTLNDIHWAGDRMRMNNRLIVSISQRFVQFLKKALLS